MTTAKAGMAKVMSLRLTQGDYRRLHAFAVSKDLRDGPAARELIIKGLAADGLELYSTELGAYLRAVMQPLIDGFDQRLEGRNAEQEDRIARVVSRASKASFVAAIAAIEAEKGIYREELRDVTPSRIYDAYSRQAGLLQAGYSLEEARERLANGKS